MKTLFYGLAFFAMFFGLISSLAFDVLFIISQPTNPETWKTLAIDFAKIVTNSQQEISIAVKEFKIAETPTYANFLIFRICGASLITLFMIFIIYKGLRFFQEAPSFSTKLLIIFTSIALVWFIGIIAGIILGEVNWIPFSGWIDLIKERGEILDFVLKEYSGKFNQTMG